MLALMAIDKPLSCVWVQVLGLRSQITGPMASGRKFRKFQDPGPRAR